MADTAGSVPVFIIMKQPVPYVFFTTRQVGLTLSQSVRGGGAVVGIDMVLDDLSASLGDMRMTPSAELALVDGHGQVLAHPDMSKVLVEGDGRFSFRPIKELDVPALRQFAGLDAPQLQPRFFDVAGRETLGVVLPFDVWPGQSMRLLVTAPVDELLGDKASLDADIFAYVRGQVTGLGVEVRDHKSPHWTGATASPGTFGHFGGSGTLLWVDPVASVRCIALSEAQAGARRCRLPSQIRDSATAALASPCTNCSPSSSGMFTWPV